MLESLGLVSIGIWELTCRTKSFKCVNNSIARCDGTGCTTYASHTSTDLRKLGFPKGLQPTMSDIVNILKDCILLQENSSYSYEFKQSIVLKNISFKYNPESSYVLKDVHLSITPGECIGFIGTIIAARVHWLIL